MGLGDELCFFIKASLINPHKVFWVVLLYIYIYIYVAFAEIGAYHIHCVAVKISSR